MDIQVEFVATSNGATSGGGDTSDPVGLGFATAFGDRTRVHVRLPDGTTDSFTVAINALGGDVGVSAFAAALAQIAGIFELDILPDPSNTGGSSLRQSRPRLHLHHPRRHAL